ncbi:ATP-dependent DNA helicase [Candidatus Woesearchaeota archaeon]|nr:ATP-dependent DNA helicase [Candidatus Woesearchaeota archaeon]
MISKEKKQELLFAHKNVRESQNKLILKIEEVVNQGKNIVAHAPTGLGKTAAAIGPALSYALSNDKTVFFLTSRHTQHEIAIETLKAIKQEHGVNFDVVDMIGKKWMCPVPGVEKLFSSEFAEYCKTVKESDRCEFFTNTKTKAKLSVLAKDTMKNIRALMPMHAEKLYEICIEKRLCPYEISSALSKNARVIVADYFYIFSQKIRDVFFSKTDTELEDVILIVDEGHNVPSRVKDLATERLTSIGLKRAVLEAQKFKLNDLVSVLTKIHDIFLDYSKGLKTGQEKKIEKDDFAKKIRDIADYEELIATLELAAINIREEKKQSYLGVVSSFLEAWRGDDEGFARIFSIKESKKEDIMVLSYRCLDPSIITSEPINTTHSSIIMSGTLTPTHMYSELLGIKNAEEIEFESPFPKENKLNLIVPGVSTKFTARSEEQFKKIARFCADMANNVPGNSAIYFPSYYLLSAVSKHFDIMSEKTVIKEISGLTKLEKADVLKTFKKYSKTGAVLLGVISGSFGEGIDLPGDYLKCVVVVGLPLSQPDLETKSLIDYYDKRFGKGWEYGYIAPAFNKGLQAAGRCIRSETDVGATVFLDDRYTWDRYYRYFPKDWDMKITKTPKINIKEFFEKN